MLITPNWFEAKATETQQKSAIRNFMFLERKRFLFFIFNIELVLINVFLYSNIYCTVK
jgi:hypothetical protein